MLIPDKAVSGPISYGSSLIISLGYMLMTCSLAAFADMELRGCAYAAVAFASVYATLICLVYFTQLTTVWQQAASVDLLDALAYRPGSWMFHLDMLGYAMLSLSTIFAGLSITAKTKGETWLRRLMLIHGVFAVTCMLFPILGLFTQKAGDTDNDLIGVIVLEFWCIYFLPITVLFAGYMKRCKNKTAEMTV